MTILAESQINGNWWRVTENGGITYLMIKKLTGWQPIVESMGTDQINEMYNRISMHRVVDQYLVR